MPPIPVPQMYDCFEERPLERSTIPGRRRRRVDAELITPEEVRSSFPSQYTWWRTREFEGTQDASSAEGVWPINHNRVHRYYGDPGDVRLPRGVPPSKWPSNIDDLARQIRHHYFRVWSAEECRRVIATRGLRVQRGYLDAALRPDGRATGDERRFRADARKDDVGLTIV
jgi:hypothetical protein